MQTFISQWRPPPLPGLTPGQSLSPRAVYDIYQKDRTSWQVSLVSHLLEMAVVINTGTQGFGPDLPATPTLVISSYQHAIVAPGTVQFIRTSPNLPASHVTLIAVADFTLVTGGNISFGKTVKANQAVMLNWNPVRELWYPIVSIADLGDIGDSPGKFTVSAVDVNRRALIDFTQPGHIGQILPWMYDYTAVWQSTHAYTFTTYITDSNGAVQMLQTAGTSGGSPPTWSVLLDGLTTDGTAVWQNVGSAGAASIILQSPKYLLVEAHQATPAEIRFANASGVVVSKFTKGATAGTDLALIPATASTGTFALGDPNAWNHLLFKAAVDLSLQAPQVNVTAGDVALNLGTAGAPLASLVPGAVGTTDLAIEPTTNGVGVLSLGRTHQWASVDVGATAVNLVTTAVNVGAANINPGAAALNLGATSVNLTGKVAQYRGIATVSNGVPAEYATVDLTGQTAAIGATTLYAVPADGMYRISYVATVTTVASISSVLGGGNGFQVVYTNADGSVVVTSPAGPTSSLNTTQAYVSGTLIVYAKSGTNIQYVFGYTSVNAAEMVYALRGKLEAL